MQRTWEVFNSRKSWACFRRRKRPASFQENTIPRATKADSKIQHDVRLGEPAPGGQALPVRLRRCALTNGHRAWNSPYIKRVWHAPCFYELRGVSLTFLRKTSFYYAKRTYMLAPLSAEVKLLYNQKNVWHLQFWYVKVIVRYLLRLIFHVCLIIIFWKKYGN